MTCGIYLLTFGTDLHYIGQSIDIEGRYKSHLSNLRRNLGSQKMQKAYELYGNPNLEILIECTENELNENENLAIEIYDTVNTGLNTLERAEDMPKWKNLLKGEDSGTSVYSNKDILEAAKLICDPDTPLVYIAEFTGINYATIRKISQGVQHIWLKEQYPEIWNDIQAARAAREMSNRSKHGNKVKHFFTAEALGIEYPLVISPEGQTYKITNLTEFCQMHDLQRSNFRKVLHGKRATHKGWKVFKECMSTSST